MNKFDIYITFIFLIKIGFITMVLIHLYLKLKHRENTELDKKILYWKDRLEFFFIVLMSFLLIYLFNPRYDKSILIDRETKILLYMFGFVLLITSNWNVLIKESPLFLTIQKIIGK
jgi:hypothetical protein